MPLEFARSRRYLSLKQNRPNLLLQRPRSRNWSLRKCIAHRRHWNKYHKANECPPSQWQIDPCWFFPQQSPRRVPVAEPLWRKQSACTRRLDILPLWAVRLHQCYLSPQTEHHRETDCVLPDSLQVDEHDQAANLSGKRKSKSGEALQLQSRGKPFRPSKMVFAVPFDKALAMWICPRD